MKHNILSIGADQAAINRMVNTLQKLPEHAYCIQKSDDSGIDLLMNTLELMNAGTIVQMNVDGIALDLATDACHTYMMSHDVTVYSENDIQEWLKSYARRYPRQTLPAVATTNLTDKREEVLRRALAKLKASIIVNTGYTSGYIPAVFDEAAEESRYISIPVAASYILTALYCKETNDTQISLYDNRPDMGERIARYCTNSELSVDVALPTFIEALPTAVAGLSICEPFDIVPYLTRFIKEVTLGYADADKGKFHFVNKPDTNGNMKLEGIYVHDERICDGNADRRTLVNALIKCMC